MPPAPEPRVLRRWRRRSVLPAARAHVRADAASAALALDCDPLVLEQLRWALFQIAGLPVRPAASLRQACLWLRCHPLCPLVACCARQQGREVLWLADPADFSSELCLDLPLATTQICAAARKIFLHRAGLAA